LRANPSNKETLPFPVFCKKTSFTLERILSAQIFENNLQYPGRSGVYVVETMNSDIKTLFEFLEHFGPEVSGRGTTEPKNGAAARLERFARGECDEAERVEVCRLLRMHPTWLRWLAERVKLARASAAAH